MKELDYWSRLKILKIRSLQRRREKIIILHAWKILHGFYPNDINLQSKEHLRTNSLKIIVLKPLSKVRGRILTQYKHSFVIKSAKLWNILPPKISNINDLNAFNTELDKFLDNIPDQPPLPNYPNRNNNSLLEHCGLTF